MAQLTAEQYPLPTFDRDGDESYSEYAEREEAAFQELLDDPDEVVYRYPFADGYAFYRVDSWEPLVLQHVPFGDAWALPAPHIRGLRREDIERSVSAQSF